MKSIYFYVYEEDYINIDLIEGIITNNVIYENDSNIHITIKRCKENKAHDIDTIDEIVKKCEKAEKSEYNNCDHKYTIETICSFSKNKYVINRENGGYGYKFCSSVCKKNMFNNDEDFYLFEFEENKKKFKIKFVGFLYVDEIIIISLPKIFKKQGYIKQYEQEKQTELLKKLFFKYHDKLKIKDKLYANYANDLSHNQISIARNLGCLYQKRGLYKKLQSTFNISHGKTHWGKTVSRIRADIIDNVPFYNKYIRRTVHGEDTELSNVHRSVLYHIFKENSLESIFPFKIDIDRPELKFKSIIENKDYYIHLLKNEISCIFDDDFIDVFQNIIYFLNNANDSNKITSYQVYGLMNFEYIFELMLGDFLENQMEQKIINGKLQVSYNYNGSFITDINTNDKLRDHYIKTVKNLKSSDFCPFEYSKHKIDLNMKDIKDRKTGILVPDIVINNNKQHAIIDAKYYKLNKMPGVNDIIKQIFYKYLLNTLINTENTKKDNEIFNCFFISQYSDQFKNKEILFTYLDYINFYGIRSIDIVGVNVELLIKIILKISNTKYNKNNFFNFLEEANKNPNIGVCFSVQEK